MNNILNKYFKDETIFITGSSYYKIPDITSKDIDVCILCNDANEHYYKIINSIIFQLTNRTSHYSAAN